FLPNRKGSRFARLPLSRRRLAPRGATAGSFSRAGRARVKALGGTLPARLAGRHIFSRRVGTCAVSGTPATFLAVRPDSRACAFYASPAVTTPPRPPFVGGLITHLVCRRCAFRELSTKEKKKK